jgi:hypothetical protein
MGDIGSQVKGWPVQAADASALWDKLANGKPHQEGAIIVYPQSLGDPNTRQFFNNGYWCALGRPLCDAQRAVAVSLTQAAWSLPVILRGRSIPAHWCKWHRLCGT